MKPKFFFFLLLPLSTSSTASAFAAHRETPQHDAAVARARERGIPADHVPQHHEAEEPTLRAKAGGHPERRTHHKGARVNVVYFSVVFFAVKAASTRVKFYQVEAVLLLTRKSDFKKAQNCEFNSSQIQAIKFTLTPKRSTKPLKYFISVN